MWCDAAHAGLEDHGRRAAAGAHDVQLAAVAGRARSARSALASADHYHRRARRWTVGSGVDGHRDAADRLRAQLACRGPRRRLGCRDGGDRADRRVRCRGAAGLDGFSHVEVLSSSTSCPRTTSRRGTRRPRGRADWPEVGIFAQRGRNRPNRIGLTTCAVLGVDGRTVRVHGLDAVDGTPVLDLKPHMVEFAPRGEVRQPAVGDRADGRLLVVTQALGSIPYGMVRAQAHDGAPIGDHRPR